VFRSIIVGAAKEWI